MNDGTAPPLIPAPRASSEPMERWLPVMGYEGFYEVSDLGRVKSLPRVTRLGVKVPLRLKSQMRTTSGPHYLRVSLSKDGLEKLHAVHQLVAEAFFGSRPEGLMVRHLDGNGLNNILSNLTYGTSSENNMDLVRHGTHRNSRKTHCKEGHEFTPENTWRPPARGGRTRKCKICKREKKNAARARARARAMAD